ncbi:hypothetical protein caldi_16410 [Caldinitratiruptor microaerophilus]|uniref:PIN domain-containing protein n=1 Tax=Caldinitratiruptor microaerophilus TaxID=671077 RepID=A0AA35CNE0_9FIRM|nr:hypothetical protein caldi_16410 [Caldinitratiruptor microaerophilus]
MHRVRYARRCPFRENFAGGSEARRLGYDAARVFLRTVQAGEGTGLLVVEYGNRERLGRAKTLFQEIRDPRLSLVDALSFAIMRELGLRRCFAFDDHFPQAGFEPVA